MKTNVIIVDTKGLNREQINEILTTLIPTKPIKKMTIEELHMNLFGNTSRIKNIKL